MSVDPKPSVRYHEIRPRRKPAVRLIVGVMLSILGKSFASASRFQKDVRREVSIWPETFSFEMRVEPDGPSILLTKKDGILKFIRRRHRHEHSKSDLVISFKNMRSAYLLLTARMSTVRGYCEKRMSVSGDITIATSIIRCMNTIETYLFPRCIARMVVKRVPRISLLSKTMGRIRIYSIGIILGR